MCFHYFSFPVKINLSLLASFLSRDLYTSLRNKEKPLFFPLTAKVHKDCFPQFLQSAFYHYFTETVYNAIQTHQISQPKYLVFFLFLKHLTHLHILLYLRWSLDSRCHSWLVILSLLSLQPLKCWYSLGVW